MNKFYKLVLIFTITVIILFYSGCSNSQPLRIGFITDLSSRNSQLGTIARNGVLMAVEEVNEMGGINGRKIELLIRDHMGDKEECFRAASDLVDQEVSVIIGPLVSGMAAAVIRATEDKRCLVISPTVSTDELTGIDDLFLRVIAPASAQGHYLALAAISRGDKKIILVQDQKNIEYARAVAEGFRAKIKTSPAEVLNELSFQDKTEFQEIARKIEQTSPDAIIFIASGIDTAGIVQQYAKSYSVPHLYGSMWTKITKVNEYGGKTVEDMILVDSYANKIPIMREMEFDRLFEERFNIKANFAARYTYESVHLFAAAAKISSSYRGDDLKAEILKMDPIHGVTDDYRLDQYGDVVRKQSHYIIKDNKYELFEISL